MKIDWVFLVFMLAVFFGPLGLVFAVIWQAGLVWGCVAFCFIMAAILVFFMIDVEKTNGKS